MIIRVYDKFAPDCTVAIWGGVDHVSCGTVYFTDGDQYSLSSDEDWEEVE